MKSVHFTSAGFIAQWPVGFSHRWRGSPAILTTSSPYRVELCPQRQNHDVITTFRWRIIRTAASVLIWRKTKRARSILLVGLCLPLCQARTSNAGLPWWTNRVIGLRLKRFQKTQKTRVLGSFARLLNSWFLCFFFFKTTYFFSLYLSGDRHDLFSFVNLYSSNIGISFFPLSFIVCSGLFTCSSQSSILHFLFPFHPYILLPLVITFYVVFAFGPIHDTTPRWFLLLICFSSSRWTLTLS